jgi:galactokinase/mevalonate kinase-like predicted kinase
MIRVTAPGRAGIVGNPTDGYGGSMIACAVQNRAIVEIEESSHLTVENKQGKWSLTWRNDFDNRGDSFDIARSVLRYYKLYDLKANIRFHSEVPVQAGMAGSTALLSAIQAAVLAYIGVQHHQYHMAELNRIIELNYMKCQCGYQDAYMTTFGGLNYLDFRGKEYYKELDKEIYATVEPLGAFVGDMPFVLAHTGVKHHSGNFHRPLRERWLEGDKAVIEGYKEIAHIAREGKKALLAQRWDELGYLMNKNHEIQDSLSRCGNDFRHPGYGKNDGGRYAVKRLSGCTGRNFADDRGGRRVQPDRRFAVWLARPANSIRIGGS